MAPSLGYFLLWLSLFFAITQFYFSRRISKAKLISISVNGLLISSLVSFFLLMYSHIVSDFSVLNVFQNSHTTKPFIYKIAGVWGNHEGSMLLWILVLNIFNYFLFKLYNKKKLYFCIKNFRNSGIYLGGFYIIYFTNIKSF